MQNEDKKEASFFDHLEELRWRFIKAFISVFVMAIPCWIFWQKIFDVLMIYPLRLSNPKPTLIFTAPAEAFFLGLKIAAFGGITLAAPVVFYQLWKFIAPGLYDKEKVLVLPIVISSTILFLSGVSFSYLVIPHVISFLTSFGTGRMNALFSSSEYLGFLIKLMVAFGVVFELPVLSFVLTRMGLLTPKFLIKNLRYAIILIFTVSAILTPPDIVSQIFLAFPLFVLYGISIIVSYLVSGKSKK